MSKIVIIGNGIAGITAARHIRKKSAHEITVISAESEYFFSRTALMYVYMGHMKFKHLQPYENWFWQKNKIDLIHDKVVELRTSEKLLVMASGEQIIYDKLILALGSKPRTIPIKGRELSGVQSLYSKQDLERMFEQTKHIQQAVIIGGGLIGVEMAEMLHSKGIAVTMIVREKNYWDNVLPPEESVLVSKHILSRGIDLKLDCNSQSINGADHVESVTTTTGELLPAQFVGITVGVEPNIDLIKNSPIQKNIGIVVNQNLETSVEDIYAIGDCVEINTPMEGRKAIEQVWYTGRMMGETVAETITGEKTAYDPGIWFNSAKFFDLEYQTYGWVPNSEEPGLDSFYWQDPKNERSLRIVYKAGTETVAGFNAMGLRLRHEVCDQWIADGKTLADAIENLKELNFDPEFYNKFEKMVLATFNANE